MTQEELADNCRLNIRTIQRIEAGNVLPRSYTIRLINGVLGTQFEPTATAGQEIEEINNLRQAFRKRKKIRIATACAAVFLMIAVVIFSSPSWVLLGMPKRVWAPFFYLIMFAHFIGIALTWRCPACNGLLGDVMNTRYCSKCGLKFYS